jgi:hypothetical protein
LPIGLDRRETVVPYSCTIDVARRRITCRAEGVLTERDIFDEQPRVRSHPDFDATFGQLIDLTAADNVHLDYSSMSSVVNTTVFRSGVRRAIVAHTSVQYGIARMFQALSERNNDVVAVFRNHADAEAWLATESPPP